MCVVKCRFLPKKKKNTTKKLMENYSHFPGTYKIKGTAVIDRIPEGVFVGKIVLFPNSIHLALRITSVAHFLIFTDSVV